MNPLYTPSRTVDIRERMSGLDAEIASLEAQQMPLLAELGRNPRKKLDKEHADLQAKVAALRASRQALEASLPAAEAADKADALAKRRESLALYRDATARAGESFLDAARKFQDALKAAIEAATVFNDKYRVLRGTAVQAAQVAWQDVDQVIERQATMISPPSAVNASFADWLGVLAKSSGISLTGEFGAVINTFGSHSGCDLPEAAANALDRINVLLDDGRRHLDSLGA